jgi:hypothetical protein
MRFMVNFYKFIIIIFSFIIILYKIYYCLKNYFLTKGCK